MSLLFIKEEEAQGLITMPQAIDAVEGVFRAFATGDAQNVPRQRVHLPGVMLHSLSASVAPLKYVGWKNYTTTRMGAKFHIALYDQEGQWVALLEADWLGQLRTGAASGVATRRLSKFESRSVGVFGSGKQARTQLEAVCAVRDIEHAHVYSATAEYRESFAEEMTAAIGLPITPTDDPAECAAGKDILITATKDKEPVLKGEFLEPGMHINAIGSNALNRAELTADCFPRLDRIVCDDIDACRNEAGDFVQPLEEDLISWEEMTSLADLLTVDAGAREGDEEITLFKSVGMAIEDIAVAAIVYRAAREQGLGTTLDI